MLQCVLLCSNIYYHNIMNLRVKEICKAKGITIGDLSKKIGMVRESLSRAINGNPQLDTLEKIATALDVEIVELFAEKSELYGVVIYRGVTYKINTRSDVERLWELLK